MELQDSSSRVILSNSEGDEILRPSVEGRRMTICSISLDALRVARIGLFSLDKSGYALTAAAAGGCYAVGASFHIQYSG